MKLPLAIVLGLLAALFAAILVSALGSGSSSGSGLSLGGGDQEILLTTRELPAGHVLKEGDLKSQVVSAASLPAGSIGATGSALGRVLIAPMVENQVLTESRLASLGSGPEIAAMLRGGYRASTITLSDRGPGVFVYPGSLVDVIATFEVPDGHPNEGELVSRTVLEGAHVLAVEGFATGEGEPEPEASRRGSLRGPMLTLLLTPTQAQILQLATTLGSVSVTLRPPAEFDRSAGTTVTLEELLDYEPPQIITPDLADESTSSVESAPDQPSRRSSTWTTEIIRNGTRSTVTFNEGGGA